MAKALDSLNICPLCAGKHYRKVAEWDDRLCDSCFDMWIHLDKAKREKIVEYVLNEFIKDYP
jgi:hypothetical protein